MPANPPARSSACVAMVTLFFCGCDKPPAPTPSAATISSSPARDQSAKPARISAKELSQLCVQDFHATFEKYKDKLLEVEGEVAFATPYYKSGPAVSLAGVKTTTGTLRHNRDIWCEFSSNQAKQVVRIAPGQ